MSQERLDNGNDLNFHTSNKDEDSPVLKALERHFQKYPSIVSDGVIGKTQQDDISFDEVSDAGK